jgi:hypothetical protein
MEKVTGLDLLREPFPAHQISKLPKPTASKEVMEKLPKASCSVCGGYHATSKIIHLDYVGHAALTDRLLDVDPNWSWEPVAFGSDGLPAFDKIGGLWVRLTVLGVTRLGYGNPDGKTGGNAIKEAIGDALRNAAMRFGAALDLWHKGDLHLDEPQDQEPQVVTISPDKILELRRLLAVTMLDESEWLIPTGFQSVDQIPENQYQKAHKILKNLAGEK